MNRTRSFALVVLMLALTSAAVGLPAPSAAMAPAGGNIPLVYDLLDLGPAHSVLLSINEVGQVAGLSDNHGAFFYDGAAFVALPMPGGVSTAQPTDLNASGEIVGTIPPLSPSRPCAPYTGVTARRPISP